jgi:DNA adenine methylase
MHKRIQKPILRWAGGKTWLLKELYRFLPPRFNDYHEPFLGGGSVFFNIRVNRKAYLSDCNFDLINAYSQIRDNPEDVISLLAQFRNSKEDYYKIRGSLFGEPSEKAAQFIFLNRTCFNGIYRVNVRGEYNVPYGFKSYKQLFDFDRLREVSNLLKSAILSCSDFADSLLNIKEGDLVFLDPPYTVSHIKNGFIKYNEHSFMWKDQIRLASFISEVNRRGAYYVLTNAKHESIEELFGKIASPTTVSRASVIGGRSAKRGIIEEYVFSNAL